MLFDSIKYVTSGITLIAFIVATIAWAYRARLNAQKQTIELAKPDDRAALVERTLEFFTVDTEGLTNKQKYELALKQVEARATRFLISAVLALLATIVAAAVTVVFLLRPSTADSRTGRRVTLVKVDGDDAVFAVGKYHNFVVKAFDSNGNPAVGVKIAWSTPVGGTKAYVDVTNNQGTSSATNLYTFPAAGLYEQLAQVVPDDTLIGWTTTSVISATGPIVKYKYTQQLQSGCPGGQYHEQNGIIWTLTHIGNNIELKRDGDVCAVTLTSPDNSKWSGTLQCTNGASYPVTMTPNVDCSLIPSSQPWFTLYH